MKYLSNLLKIAKRNWHFILIIAICLTPLLWFMGKGGNVLINGIDTNFPLDPLVWFKRRFFVWDNVVNAGRDFSSSTAGVFFHLIQLIPYYLGFSLQITQIISILFWFSAVVFSAYVFSRTFLKRNFFAQLIFVVLYSFNIYLFNTWENIKVANIALVIALPLFISVFYYFKEGKIFGRKLLFYLSLILVLTFGIGINPAYFISLLGGVTLYVLTTFIGEKKNRKRLLKGCGLSALALLLINLYWILPLINFLFFSKTLSTLEDLGFTDWVVSLSKEASLMNLLRLQGAWDWYVVDQVGFPLYIPYALNYFFKFPFIIFSFITPSLAVLSLFFRKKTEKNWYIFFGLMLLVGIFLGAGTHPPTGNLYMLLLKYVPFFSFFRSPWYIFTPYVTLALAGLTSLLFLRLFEVIKGNRVAKEKVKKNVLYSLGAIFLISHLLYSYPLITGKIFRPGRADSFYVEFPDYVWEAKSYLEESSIDGRFITYPDDDLESFEWGYRGTESILGLFSEQEYIAPSFNIENVNYKALLQNFYAHLKVGEYESAINMLPAFGAKGIFVKDDASSHAPKLNHEKLERLGERTQFGQWSFYVFDEIGKKKITSTEFVYTNFSVENSDVFASTIDILRKDSITVDFRDSEAKKVGEIESRGLVIKEFKNSSLENFPSSRNQTFNITNIKKRSYYFAIEKNGFSANDLALFSDTINFENVSIKETDSMAIFGPLELSKGDHEVKVIFPETSDFIQKENYLQYYDAKNLRDEDKPSDPSKTLIINPGAEGVEITIPTTGFNAFYDYELSLDHKFFYGHGPIVDMVQYSPSTPLKVTATNLGDSFDWETIKIKFEPAEIESNLDIIVRIPESNKGDKSKSFIENISLKKIYDNKMYLIEDGEPAFSNLPKISFKKINPTKYEVDVKNITGNYVLVFLESYSPDWKLTSKDFIGKPIHFSVNGYANAWYVSGNTDTQRLTLSYKPQILYNIGAIISISTFLLVIFTQKKRK